MKYLVDQTSLTDIADKIRIKLNTTKSYYLSQMPSAIESIGNTDYDAENGLVTRLESNYKNNRINLVGSYTFYNHPNIQKLTFENVIRIGESAFQSCFRLSQISLPKCQTVAAYAFTDCSALRSIDMQTCYYIGIEAFKNCISLSKISFPNCRSIYNNAFEECRSLQSAIFPECTFLESQTFLNCTNLSLASFPNIETINTRMFEGCSNLKSVSFPVCYSVLNSAFKDCINLESINLPCQIINSYVFQNCTSLSDVQLSRCQTLYSSAFLNCTNLSFIQLSQCSVIHSYAFQNCINLTSISFPRCTSLMSSVFYGCFNLSYIEFPILTTIGSSIFSNHNNFKSVYFPQVSIIYNSAFHMCQGLQNITFPKCETVGDRAFSNCYNLKNISIPKCKVIGYEAFRSCSSLTSIYFSECTNINGVAFYNCINLTSLDFPKCTTIESEAFGYCTGPMKSLNFPQCIRMNGYYTFRHCRQMSKINFPKCTTVGNSAFMQCWMLESFSFPQLTYFPYAMFVNCRKLSKNIYFSSVLTGAINDYAFQRCITMSKVFFTVKPQSMYYNTFREDYNITDIYVPWANGALGSAPWSATNAVIHYDTVYNEEPTQIYLYADTLMPNKVGTTRRIHVDFNDLTHPFKRDIIWEKPNFISIDEDNILTLNQNLPNLSSFKITAKSKQNENISKSLIFSVKQNINPFTSSIIPIQFTHYVNFDEHSVNNGIGKLAGWKSENNYEGFDIPLSNLIIDKEYYLSFSYKFSSYFRSDWYVGCRINENPSTRYQDYQNNSWANNNNLIRDTAYNHFNLTFTATAQTMYLQFNFCGLGGTDENANFFDITDITLYQNNQDTVKEIFINNVAQIINQANQKQQIELSYNDYAKEELKGVTWQVPSYISIDANNMLTLKSKQNNISSFNITAKSISNSLIQTTATILLKSALNYATEGLQIYYDGINNSGNGHNNSLTTWKDLSGNENNGIITNGTWNTNELLFNGSSTWVNCNNKQFFTENITIEAVFKFNQTYTTTAYIAGNLDSGGYGLGNYGNYSKITGIIYRNNSWKRVDGSLIDTNNYYHYVLTYDGRNYKIYTNGKLINTLHIQLPVIPPQNNVIFILGANPNANNTRDSYINGNMKSFRLYNRALTDQEVELNYTYEKARYNF